MASEGARMGGSAGRLSECCSEPSARLNKEQTCAALKTAIESEFPGCCIHAQLGRMGGVSVCFAAWLPTLGEVAVKVTMMGYMGEGTNIARLAETEVKAYQKLKQRQKGASIAPQLLGHGALKINGASHPYMVMQRLGESLELFTDDRGLELPKTVFVQYALEMVDCLQALHGVGLVHLDVKPANFCLREREQQQKEGAPSVCIIDLGGAQKRPSKQQAGMPLPFFGTTDFAGSTAMQLMYPGPGDDLESLAYSLLYMWRGGLPWNFADYKAGAEGWSNEQMEGMLQERTAAWEKALEDWDIIPQFIQDIHKYATKLQVWELPDYSIVRRHICTAAKQQRPLRESRCASSARSKECADSESSSPSGGYSAFHDESPVSADAAPPCKPRKAGWQPAEHNDGPAMKKARVWPLRPFLGCKTISADGYGRAEE